MAGGLVGVDPAEVVVVTVVLAVHPFGEGRLAVLVLDPVNPFDAPVNEVVEIAALESPVVVSGGLRLILGGIGQVEAKGVIAVGRINGLAGNRDDRYFVTGLGQFFLGGIGLDADKEGEEVARL